MIVSFCKGSILFVVLVWLHLLAKTVQGRDATASGDADMPIERRLLVQEEVSMPIFEPPKQAGAPQEEKPLQQQDQAQEEDPAVQHQEQAEQQALSDNQQQTRKTSEDVGESQAGGGVESQAEGAARNAHADAPVHQELHVDIAVGGTGEARQVVSAGQDQEAGLIAEKAKVEADAAVNMTGVAALGQTQRSGAASVVRKVREIDPVILDPNGRDFLMSKELMLIAFYDLANCGAGTDCADFFDRYEQIATRLPGIPTMKIDLSPAATRTIVENNAFGVVSGQPAGGVSVAKNPDGTFTAGEWQLRVLFREDGASQLMAKKVLTEDATGTSKETLALSRDVRAAVNTLKSGYYN
ncbi:unnamed protein product [Amoebophrya sp. A25]|nr:unnamed protein product [Amoebophrya sp. A25]|eukprot:GSA25T00023795001.1